MSADFHGISENWMLNNEPGINFYKPRQILYIPTFFNVLSAEVDWKKKKKKTGRAVTPTW